MSASFLNASKDFSSIFVETQYAILTYPGQANEVPGTNNKLNFLACLQNSLSSSIGDFTNK